MRAIRHFVSESVSGATTFLADSPPADVAGPVGRSYFSTDPQNSAAWWLRYTTATPTEDDGTVGHGVSEAAVAVQVQNPLGHEVQRLYFLSAPDWRSTVNTSMRDFVHAAAISWDTVMMRRQQYEPWTDFHDGFLMNTLRLDELAQQRHPLQLYDRCKVARTYIPNTTYTSEWLRRSTKENDPGCGLLQTSAPQYLEESRYDDPDACRDNSDFEQPVRTLWKATFAVLDAGAARDFAIHVLGGSRIPEPYPWPADPNCIAAQWVSLPVFQGDLERLA
ncbi:unnamed protein product [Symbiodinium natans]|uniref:Uncharacterized protein n=1 Tax=Symbiodinium natans TaxID=878477 RepID=A0A812JJF5_9DINO|nr:unnamed protein product [Symbiodinium natans]